VNKGWTYAVVVLNNANGLKTGFPCTPVLVQEWNRFSISVTTGAHETFDQASLTVYVKTRWLTDSCNVHTVSKRDVHQHHFVFFTCDASSSCTSNLFHLLLHHNFFVYYSSSLFTSFSSSCAKYLLHFNTYTSSLSGQTTRVVDAPLNTLLFFVLFL
jgi:hypothetical protein